MDILFFFQTSIKPLDMNTSTETIVQISINFTTVYNNQSPPLNYVVLNVAIKNLVKCMLNNY